MGYTLFGVARPRQRLVHIYPSPDESAASSRLRSRSRRASMPSPGGGEDESARRRNCALARAARKISRLDRAAPQKCPSTWAAPSRNCRASCPPTHRHHRRGNFRLGASLSVYALPVPELGPISGSWAIRAAAAVSPLRLPIRTALIGCVGDGGFMCRGRKSTAVNTAASRSSWSSTNTCTGTILMHHEPSIPSAYRHRSVNPAFAALGARARRPRRDRDQDQGIRARLRARGEVGQARGDRA